MELEADAVFELIANRSMPEPNSGCHLWYAGADYDGYGLLKIGRRNYRATRLLWEALHGPIPRGLVVRHKCDVPSCVNPNHLSLGTFQQNANDGKSRGRYRGPGVRTQRGVYRGASLRSKLVVPVPVTYEYLIKALAYNPDNGEFRWLERDDVEASWNTRYAGTIAGSGKGAHKRVNIGNKTYLLHRLAWLYVYGVMPDGEIDHRDRDPANNRISNLRLVTHAENSHNTGLRRNNTSGHKGVSWDAKRQKWQAMITHESNAIPLGRYDRFEDAVAARQAAEIKYRGSIAA